MKFLLNLVLCLCPILALTQINGNRTLKTITIPVENLTEIDIQFNANITLDFTQKEVMTITAEENLIALIGKKFKGGKLTLDQIKWIEPTIESQITIGCPKLVKIYQGTHSTTQLVNVNARELYLEGNVGQIIASGKVGKLNIKTSSTDMQLSKLEIDRADVKITNDAKVMIDKVNQLDTKLDNDARLIVLSSPKKETENSRRLIGDKSDWNYTKPDIKWIKFKIKNNSWKRNNFVVVGPKKDGSTFSYGFPMMPGFTREENWTVGTKIYKEGFLGSRKLLVTIRAEDEGKTVKLFQ